MLKWLFGRNNDSIGIELGDNLIVSGDGDLFMKVGDNLAIDRDDSSVSVTLDLDGKD